MARQNAAANAVVEHGTVKWFNDAKGFGFITPESGGKDLFVHYTSIVQGGGGRKSLEENDKVTFVAVEGTKGPAADRVTRV